MAVGAFNWQGAGFSAVFNCRIAPKCQIASWRDKPSALIAKKVKIQRHGNGWRRDDFLRNPDIVFTIAAD